MTKAVELRQTRCAICWTEGNARELYPANFAPEALNPAVFSARRLPDRVHYRMVKCNTCGLVRSDPVAPMELVAQLYQQSSFTYTDEVTDLKRTYGRCLAELDRYGAQKDTLLEIGCGNGFFLQQALAQGYRAVRGVEPSRAAISQVPPELRDSIVCDLMRPGLFGAGEFDVICLFQVFDHVPDPGALLDACFTVLRPGGLVLSLNHNVQAVSARLLGERSPIVDIEHTYLYSPATMAKLFTAHEFRVLKAGSVWNRYSLRYLVRLLPLPAGPKQAALGWLQRASLGRLRLSVPLGNLYLVAQRPVGVSDADSHRGYKKQDLPR
jgi:SAM-dependent methyltransferase